MRIKTICIAIFSVFLLCGCSKENQLSYPNQFPKAVLSEDEVSFFKQMKIDYFNQRFMNVESNIYDSDLSIKAGADISDNNAQYYRTIAAPHNISITSIDDLTLYFNYPQFNACDCYVVSFLYCDLGLSGPWLSTGCDVYFLNEGLMDYAHFLGNNCPPEVYYNGTFYYIHEAYSLGIISFENPDIFIPESTADLSTDVDFGCGKMYLRRDFELLPERIEL